MCKTQSLQEEFDLIDAEHEVVQLLRMQVDLLDLLLSSTDYEGLACDNKDLTVRDNQAVQKIVQKYPILAERYGVEITKRL